MSDRQNPFIGKVFFRSLLAGFLLLGGVCKGQPVITVTVTNPTCAYNNGGFVVTATGGTPPYYFLSNAARESNNSGVFGGLPAGTYDLMVRDLKGKITRDSVKLTGPGTFPYFTSSVVNATGCTTNNGQVTLTPAGGTPPYQYSINDGSSFQSSNVFSNLAPGSYSIMIEDANGCITAPWSAVGVSYANFQVWSHASFVNVTAPTCGLLMTVTASAPTCGNNNSLGIASTSGGTPGYTYSLDGGGFGALTGGGFSGLSPGTHTVTVRDATGLTYTYSYTFPSDCPVTTNQTPAQCMTNTGSLTVTAASGIPPFTYSIDGTNFQAGATFNNLMPGSYTILVKDAHGVITYGSGNVVGICLGAVATTTASLCDQSTGSITAKGVNGTGPYTYSLDGVTFSTIATFPNLKGGPYTVTVKDATGQTAKTNVFVADACMTGSVTPQPASCGNANGSLNVNVSGGTAPYQYSLYGGANAQSSPMFNGYPTGFYVVTITDHNGNQTTMTAVIQNVAGPQVSAVPTAATCSNNDGTIQMLISGGTGPFQTYFNGTQILGGITNWSGLPNGNYRIGVTDQNGCQDSATVLVPLTDSLNISVDTVPATCQGVGVQLHAATNNGASFAWSPAVGLSDTTIANPVATPPLSTSYIVTATLGECTRADTVAVTVIPAPVATAGPSDTTCAGKTVQLLGSGGVQYQWSPGTYLSDSTVANPTVDTVASTITYNLAVKDANGCWSLDSAATTVVVLTPKVFAGNDTAVVVGQPLQLSAVDVSNSGFTSYVWSPPLGLSNPDIANPTTVITGDVTYTVLATTAMGCSAMDTIVIGAATTEAIIVPNAFTPNNDGHNDILRVIGYGIQSLKYFRVYDRWGRLVFVSSVENFGWDGTVGGQPAPAGTYVWSAAGVDFHGRPMEGRGTVVLVR